MKTFILILFLFDISISLPSYSQQTVTIVYSEDYIATEMRAADIRYLKAKGTTKAKKIIESLKRIPVTDDTTRYFYSLVYSQGKSIYQHDSTYGNGVAHSPFYYKDHIHNKMVMRWPSSKDTQGESGLMTPLDWDICYSDSLFIGEYKVFKATSISNGGKVIVAWFTPELPVSDGPSIYSGLPGMILMLERDSGLKTYLRAVNIYITNVNTNIQIPDLPNKISVEQYIKNGLGSIQR